MATRSRDFAADMRHHDGALAEAGGAATATLERAADAAEDKAEDAAGSIESAAGALDGSAAPA